VSKRHFAIARQQNQQLRYRRKRNRGEAAPLVQRRANGQAVGTRPWHGGRDDNGNERGRRRQGEARVITTPADLDRVRRDCRRMVTRRALAASAAAVVPVPGADLVADIGLLANMLPRISKAFELDHDSVEKLDPEIAEKIFVIAASLGNNVIGRFVSRKVAIGLLRRIGVRVASASVARYVPLIGSAFAASVSFGAMKLAGNAHIEDCYRTARALLPSDAHG
jgi:uncharacterized protein (DUF697 family)